MVIIRLVIPDWRLCFPLERLLGLEWGHCRGIIPGRLFLMDLVLIRSKFTIDEAKNLLIAIL